MSERLLLCTDLDRTLLPNGTQPESPLARKLFSRFVAQSNVSLVYVTGRHKSLVEKAINNYGLPLPDCVISDVGTRIYDLQGDHWEDWSDWEAEIAADWSGKSQTDLHALFLDIKALQKQEAEKQNTYKLSYYVPLFVNQDELMTDMYRRLADYKVDASLVWSIDEPAGIGLLDVLPRHATKLHAIEFLMARRGYNIEETVFCGDSGKALYCARGGFANMNGNYSAGVLEGVTYYHAACNTDILADEETLQCQS